MFVLWKKDTSIAPQPVSWYNYTQAIKEYSLFHSLGDKVS